MLGQPWVPDSENPLMDSMEPSAHDSLVDSPHVETTYNKLIERNNPMLIGRQLGDDLINSLPTGRFHAI